MMPAAAMQSRRRSRLPWPRHQPAAVHPVAQRPRPVEPPETRSTASAPPKPATPRPAHRRERTITSPDRQHRGQRQCPRPAPARRRGGPCRRSGPVTTARPPIRSASTACAVAAGHGGNSSRRLARAVDARHHRVQPGAAEQPAPAAAPAACRRAAGACRRCARAPAAARAVRCSTSAPPWSAPGCRNVSSDGATDSSTDASTTTAAARRRLVTATRSARPRPGRTGRSANPPVPHRLPPDRARPTAAAIIARPGEAQRAVAQPGRLPTGQHARSGVGVGLGGPGQRVGQQDRPQPRHLLGLAPRRARTRRHPWPPARC